VWNKSKYLHNINPQILDITDGVNYITFKNNLIDEILIYLLDKKFLILILLNLKEKEI
jgi:hypothetical protein